MTKAHSDSRQRPRGHPAVQLIADPGQKIYRRAIKLEMRPGQTRVELADDFHHFRIVMAHKDDRIVSVRSEGLRIPWTTCGAEAGAMLSRLRGLSLSPLRPQMSREERYSFCTHTFDMSELAIAHACDSESSLRYDIEVGVMAPAGPSQARLSRNGQEILCWEISDFKVRSVTHMEPIDLSRIPAWSRRQHYDESQMEAIWLLQRAVHISLGKMFDWKKARVASDMLQPATCYTFSPALAPKARQVENHIRDFSSLERVPLLSDGQQSD